jgi:hypothetical protein
MTKKPFKSHSIGGGMGLRADLDDMEKIAILHLPGTEPQPSGP